MKKKQLLLVGGGVVLLLALYFFGQTVPEKKANQAISPATASAAVHFDDILAKAKQKISPAQNARLTALENSITRGDVKDQKLHLYHQLARFWKDSARVFEPYAYYTAEAAKLENSEKTLTFAAQLFLDNLMTGGEPAMQSWWAANAKVLFEKALELNPANDSSKIGLGACYIFGNISDNPMQGILPVREIAQKNPDNLYAQLVLGLGGKRSGQYDKAIEHFLIIVQKQPQNTEAVFNLADCYDLKGDKLNAVKWYQASKKLIGDPGIIKDIDKRINELK